MNDEKNFYRAVAYDMMKDAWNRFNASVNSVVVILREHGFSDEEIQQLIEDARS